MLLSSTFADNTETNWNNDTQTGTSISWTWTIENDTEDEDEDTNEEEDNVSWTWANNTMRIRNEVRHEERKELNKDIKEQREEMKSQIRENREEMKNNLHDFRKENWTSSWAFNNLSDEIKAKIKTLQETFRTSTEALKKEYESKIKSATWVELKDTLRQELKTKLEEMVIAHHEQLKQLVWNDEEALAWVEARKEIAEKNKEIREENKTAREEFRGDRKGQVLAFKEKYHSQLWAKLNKVWAKSPEKLENILWKIDAMMVKFDTNTKISEANKEKIMSQLTALKELLEDSLDTEDAITAE